MARKPKAKAGIDAQGWKDRVEEMNHETLEAIEASGPLQQSEESTESETVMRRVLTFGSNGPQSAQTIAPVPERAAVVVPSGVDAEAALAEIAGLNLKVMTAHDAVLDAQERLKSKRGTWTDLSRQLQTLITKRTSAPSMPLFDAPLAESDLAAMQEAIEQGASVAQAESLEGLTSAEPSGESESASEAPAAPAMALEDETAF